MLIPTTIEETIDKEYVMMRLLSSASPDFTSALKEVINRFSHLKSMILLPETLLFLPTTTPRARTKNVYQIEFSSHKFSIKVHFKIIPFTKIGVGWRWAKDYVELVTPDQIYEYNPDDIMIQSGKASLSLSNVFPGNLISFDRSCREFDKYNSQSSTHPLAQYYKKYYTAEHRAQQLSALFFDPDDAIQYMSEGMNFLKEKNLLPDLKTR